MAMGSSAMAQVNIRMNTDLKRAGDATLERANVTPTQMVRAVWAKLALGSEAMDQLMDALVREPSVQMRPDAAKVGEGDRLVERIMCRQEEFERAWGLDASTYVPLGEEEMEALLYEEARERENERMIWHAE